MVQHIIFQKQEIFAKKYEIGRNFGGGVAGGIKTSFPFFCWNPFFMAQRNFVILRISLGSQFFRARTMTYENGGETGTGTANESSARSL